jgi:aminoglycoside phosphotransferase (APT) family kinase protein
VADLEVSIREYLEKLDPAKLGLSAGDRLVEFQERGATTANLHYLAEIGGQRFLFRINRSRSPSFITEFEKLRALNSHGIAPRAFLLDKNSLAAPFMITEHIEGRPLEAKEIPEHLPQISKAFGALAKIPIADLRPPGLFQTQARTCLDVCLGEIRRLKEDLGGYIRTNGENALSDLLAVIIGRFHQRVEEDTSPFEGASLHFIHNNLQPKSMILTPSKALRLVNWEAAEIGDRAKDILALMDHGIAAPDALGIANSSDAGLECRLKIYRELAAVESVIEAAGKCAGIPATDPAAASRAKEDLRARLAALGCGEIMQTTSAAQDIPKGDLDDFLKFRPRPTSAENSAGSPQLTSGLKLKKVLKSKKFILGVSLAIYSGFYDYYRKPVLLETRNIAGVPFEIIGKRNSNFPGSYPLDGLIWGEGEQNRTIKYKDGHIVVKINKGVIERNGKSVQRKWDEFIKNNEYFLENDGLWRSERQIVYELFKESPKSKIAELYTEESMKSTIAHETQHVEDGVTEHNELESEVRAYLHELTVSPIALHKLESFIEYKDLKKFPEQYVGAANIIMNGLLSYPDIKSWRDIYKLPKKEISNRSKEIFDTRYADKKSGLGSPSQIGKVGRK